MLIYSYYLKIIFLRYIKDRINILFRYSELRLFTCGYNLLMMPRTYARINSYRAPAASVYFSEQPQLVKAVKAYRNVILYRISHFIGRYVVTYIEYPVRRKAGLLQHAHLPLAHCVRVHTDRQRDLQNLKICIGLA